VFPVGSPFRVSQPLDHATFPVSATSNAACSFPALRSPVCFTTRLMGPVLPGRRSALSAASGGRTYGSADLARRRAPLGSELRRQDLLPAQDPVARTSQRYSLRLRRPAPRGTCRSWLAANSINAAIWLAILCSSRCCSEARGEASLPVESSSLERRSEGSSNRSWPVPSGRQRVISVPPAPIAVADDHDAVPADPHLVYQSVLASAPGA
jgi:hypothetical protein